MFQFPKLTPKNKNTGSSPTSGGDGTGGEGEEASPSKSSTPRQQHNPFSFLAKPFDDAVVKPFQKAADAMKLTPRKDKEGSGDTESGTDKQHDKEEKAPTTKKKTGFLQKFTSPQHKQKDSAQQQERSIKDQQEEETPIVALGLDTQLESMNVIITKTLPGVSARDWYETCWSEGVRTDKPPFYGPWLADTDKSDVDVEDWTFADDDAQDEDSSAAFVNDWDKERYQQTRKVEFKMERSSGMYPGPTTTDVTHTQYCRLEAGDRRCVVTSLVKMAGIPFADSFYVAIRYVGTNKQQEEGGDGDGDGLALHLQVGLFVVFVKQVIVAGKIRSGTTQQTTKAQLNLVLRMVSACCPSTGAVAKSATAGEEGTEKGLAMVPAAADLPQQQLSSLPLALDSLSRHLTKMVAMCFPFLAVKPRGGGEGDEDDIERAMREIRVNLRIIRGLPSAGDDGDDSLKYVLDEFQCAQEGLDQCVMKLLGKGRDERETEDVATETDDAGVVVRVSRGAEQFLEPVTRPIQAVFRGIAGIKPPPFPLRELLLGSSPDESKEEEVGTVLEGPDKVLQGMNVVYDKKIPQVSIEKIHESCLSKPFYKPWLEGLGATDVNVEDWVTPEEGGSFSDGWSGETYSQKRKVTYCFDRKSVIGIGTVACDVTQFHYCRFEGNRKRLILQVSVDTAGLPFGDAHTDMIRHVYTQSDDGSVSVQIGVFIVLLKETMLSQKVRVEATREATRRQIELIRSVRASIGGGRSDASSDRLFDVEKELEKMQRFRCLKHPLESCLSRTQHLTQMYPDGMLADVESVSEQLKTIDTKVRAIEPFLEGRAPGEDNETWRFVLNKLEFVDQALDNIIVWNGDKAKGKEALDRASFVQLSV